MTASASIPQRFNGPPTSGNGGYSCGILAGFEAYNEEEEAEWRRRTMKGDDDKKSDDDG